MTKERDIFRPNEHVRPIASKIYDKLVTLSLDRKNYPNWPDCIPLKMWEITNYERAILGKGPISLEKVESAEKCAYGHLDYALKLSLYCDDLVRED